MISVSIVSHAQLPLVGALLDDLCALGRDDLQLILTVNIAEPGVESLQLRHPRLRVLRNAAPRGFGANHNAAFREARGEAFCVLNPDIRLAHDPFAQLLRALEPAQVAVVAPRVVRPDGTLEDSARRFPTAAMLLGKLLGAAPRLDYPAVGGAFSPDWVAGMFMLFRREAFAAVGGFDERYFLYYEDVDVCRRLRAMGHDVRYVPEATVTHDAQRASRRKPAYMLHHARSMLRYLLKTAV